MVTHYDVPTEDLLDALAEEFAGRDEVEPPEWAAYAKSGSGKEMPPEQTDFWERRCASLLRKVAINGPVGIERLTTEYGSLKQGSTRYKTATEHRTDAAEQFIRVPIQQLEDAGLVDTAGEEGRVVTADGQSLLDSVAGDVLEELDRDDLERYA